ncbi:MAG: folylpolyglutamate synthase/dihydrofolate synthase family protein [Armatimonadota bacterium]
MKYTEAVEYLNSLLVFGIKPGLERITELAKRFGNPQNKYKIIHVGGTNGKGSTSTFIASILNHAGYRTGLYTSPYVYNLRERIQVDFKLIPEDDFAEIMTEVKKVSDDISKNTNLGNVTEFEAKTIAAFIYYEKMNVDFAVLEVGMGGRFDATNIVTPLVSVITNISLDHTERLGNTISQIAFEKAGIIKNGSILVTSVDRQDAWKVICKKAREEGAEAWRVAEVGDSSAFNPPSPDILWQYECANGEISVLGPNTVIDGLKPKLYGKFQQVNSATAVTAVKALEKYEVKLPREAIFNGISNAYIPGRMEIVLSEPLLVIDGAHNPDSAEKLITSIKQSFKYKRLITVVGMLNNHSVQGVIKPIAESSDIIIATQPKWHKARKAEELAEEARKYKNSVETIIDVNKAVKFALSKADIDDMILITGSFYTIGEIDPLSYNI